MATLVVNRPDTSNGGFAQIPNEWLRDTRLSLIARAILAILATHNTGFEVQTEDFYGLGTGKETVAKAFRELESVSYLTRTKGRSSQGTWVHTWTLNPNAGHAPDPGKPSVDVTSDNTPSPQVSTSDGSPGPGQPGRNKKTTSKKTKNTPPPTPTSNGTSTSVEAKGREGDSFQEWIDLFPSSKRHNIRDARTKYAETIKNIEHSILMDSTRAYLDHEQQNEGGKYIGQALAVLTDRRWEKHKPKPDPNLTQLRTLEALAQNYPPDSPERQDYAESIKEERARLVQQGYVEDGAGGLKLPELTPEQRKSRADAHRRNEYLRWA